MKRPLKKTDKLEVRLPTATKQAFLAHCRAEGRSASETVRGFVEDHLARQPKELQMIVRSPFTYGGLALAAAVGVFAVLSAQPTQAQPDYAGAFKSIDRNGDGLASPQEFNGAPPAPGAPKPGQETGKITVDFAGTDTNRDGAVSLAEFTAVTRAAILKRFLALDADNDGKISLAEAQRQGALLSDTTSATEARPASAMSVSGPVARLFAKGDLDRDGAITEAEWFASLRPN